MTISDVKVKFPAATEETWEMKVCYRDNWGVYEMYSPDGNLVAIKCQDCDTMEWHGVRVVSYVCKKCSEKKLD